MKKFFILILLFLTKFSFGSITIDSTKVFPSTCQKNGAIVIYAKTDRPPMVYSILDGPEVRPAQSGNSFSSLAKGIYKVLVTNFSNDSVVRTFEVKSDYVQPEFSISFTQATCNNLNNGTITGVATNTSKKPLVWELKNITKGTTITQNNGNFTGISNDSFSLRLYDSCQNFVTRFVDLTGFDTKINNVYCFYNSSPRITCDSTILTLRVEMKQNTNASFYGKITYDGITKNVIFRILDFSQDLYTIEVGVSNLGYGDAFNIVLFNQCNDSFIYNNKLAPFNFIKNFEIANDSCQKVNNLSYNYQNDCDFPPKYPLRLVLRDVLQNLIIIDESINSNIGNFIIPDQIFGNPYQTTISDQCGNIFIDNFIWPEKIILGDPKIEINFSEEIKLDSTTTVNIKFENLILPILQMIEGPQYTKSSDPKSSYKAYYAEYAYPTFIDEFELILGVGNFKFKIRDYCNRELFFDLEITSEMVASLTDNYEPKVGCLNNNSILLQKKITISNNQGLASYGNFFITDNNNQSVFYEGSYFFSNFENNNLVARNLIDGNYTIYSFIDIDELPSDFNLIKSISGNSIIYDSILFGLYAYEETVIIPKYLRPEIEYVTTFECNGDIYVNLIPDLEKGVAPYEYEVISGPILYPLQPSNLFTFQKNGIYTARIIDACGNANVFDFSVDTLIFPPIEKYGSSCNGGIVKLAYPTSVYYTYSWQKPDGTFFVGDTLYINNVGPTDTGLYFITRYVNINGCRDSIKTTYRLEQNLTVNIQKTICEGDTLFFYGQTLTEAGVYSHIVETSGCDSVISLKLQISNLSFTLETKDTICKGDTLIFYGQTLTESGIYNHNIQITGCDSLIILNLQVLNPNLVELIFNICKGDTVMVGNENFTDEGEYNVHLLNIAGCDSTIKFSIIYDNPNLIVTASATTANLGDSVQLFATVNQGIIEYHWWPTINLSNPNIYNPFAFIDTTQWFYVKTISENGCISIDSILITVNENCKEEQVFIPNAFTPNGDNKNDVFRVKSNFTLDQMTLIILNRFGEKVFESNKQEEGWDGTFKGEKSPNDVYAYYFIGNCNGFIIERKGNITLLGSE